MERMTLADLSVFWGGERRADQEVAIRGFEADSRKIAPGGVFAALKGERVDGHTFLEEVARKGAIGAIVAQGYLGPHFGLTLFYVEDVLSSLQQLAKYHYAQKQMITVAITGSVGKTTTKEFVATLLQGKYRVLKTEGNANSQVGVALSILNEEREGDLFVVEMGMSRPGEITKLVDIAPPDIALLTKVGMSHSLFFQGGLEEIAAAKAEIFSHPKTRLALINADTADLKAIAAIDKPKSYFGWKEGVDVRVIHDLGGLVIEERGERSPPLRVEFRATHLLENFAAAVGVARRLGMSWEEIGAQSIQLKPFRRRFERIEKEGVIYLNDAYNASAESTCAALSNLPSPKAGKKRIAVLGEMRELGDFTLLSHQQVAEVAFLHVEEVLCLGKGSLPIVEYFQQRGKEAFYCEEFDLLQAHLHTRVEKGDVVLVKGANSSALWRLVEDSAPSP